jgi:lysophospholipase L1-like esterase
MKALGADAPTGLLLAEGDSWFDYPMNDVLRLLEDRHGYDVESVAHRGDCVEDMAYSAGQFEEFARRLEKLLRQGRVPDAILISGGGNDIAGDAFAVLLNHALSGLPTLNADVVRGVIDVRLSNAYAFLIGGLTELSKQYLKRPIPILTHGYAYPVPDGRGFLGGWGPLPGPWLRPGFHDKGHGDQAVNSGVMRELIDRFNAALKRVGDAEQFRHVHYLDLRGTLSGDATYKKDWANELHPTGRGFEIVADRFAAALATL